MIAVVFALPGASGAQAAGLHPQLLTRAGYGTEPIGFARTVDGRLHVAYETNTSWGNAASGIAEQAISPSGHPGPAVQALAWGGPNAGSPNGVPGLAVLPSGVLQAVFGGSPSGVEGPWGISSSDGGATWSAPVNVGSGIMPFADSNLTLQVSQGTPVLTAGCCGNVVVQRGFGPGAPTAQVTTAADGAAGNTASALDAKTGAVVASWDSNAGSGGIWLQQIAPTIGAAQKAPIPSQFGTGEPLILAGRDSGPGVFGAYAADAGPTTHVRLLRYGGGSVAVGSVKGLRAPVVGVATGPDGRIWVMWAGQVNGTGVTAVTRSNRAVTRFEPIQTHRATWSSLFTLSGDGRLGPLDMLMSAVSAPKSGPFVNGIYYARVLPRLSATVSAKKVATGKYKLTAKVTDAGDAASGATVAAKGQSKTTNSKGATSITLAGSGGDHVNVAVTKPGYAELTLRVSL
ncbi:MAG TPA: sialidase family protein [Solirubrobacteraceae bacterium]|nr:sialidase family protein [Solirubrobacteraceae bacterium]